LSSEFVQQHNHGFLKIRLFGTVAYIIMLFSNMANKHNKTEQNKTNF
jgi:hypothetical protein